jgi:hypothetical protein
LGELPKQLLAWIARLLPKQKVQGDGAIQVGKVEGGMQVVHQHFYAAAQPVRPKATATHREVLALMELLPSPVRNKVLDFMRREFNTAMVVELQPAQLLRVRRYVETINNRRKVRA